MPIAVTVAATILILRIRDEMIAISQAFPISRCSASACWEGKKGERSGWKPSFVAIWLMPPLIESIHRYSASEV
jgi:hypothetical protein